MPELPEVETVRRALEMTIDNASFEDVAIDRFDLRFPLRTDFADIITGRRIQNIDRRGKYILINTISKNGDDAAILSIHLGMSGNVFVRDGQMRGYNRRKHDHLLFQMSNDRTMIFNDPRRFGYIEYYPGIDANEFACRKKLGPEPLNDNFGPERLRASLSSRKGPIKNVLLDQSVVAGLGNIYVCEALYDAGIRPDRSAASLTKDECGRLVPAIRDVLGRAIMAGGSTLKDYTHIDGGTGYFQHSFSVYGRDGLVCPDCECKTSTGQEKKDNCIIRIVQSGRSTYYCPYKQV